VGSVNTVSAVLGDLPQMTRRVISALEGKTFHGASVDAALRMMEVIIFTTLLSRCYLVLQWLWRVDDQSEFKLTTASGRKAASSNQAVIGRYLGGKAWRVISGAGLEGAEAYRRLVVVLMGAMHGRLAFARKVASNLDDAALEKEPVNGWVRQFCAEGEVFPSPEDFFGVKSDDHTIEIKFDDVKDKVTTAMQIAITEANEFFNTSQRRPPVYVVAKKLCELIRINMLEEMCGSDAVEDIAESLTTDEGQVATGQMVGCEVVSAVLSTMNAPENRGVNADEMRRFMAQGIVNAFRLGIMDALLGFCQDRRSETDGEVQQVLGVRQVEEDKDVPRFEHISG